jgi:hypothetical protein
MSSRVIVMSLGVVLCTLCIFAQDAPTEKVLLEIGEPVSVAYGVSINSLLETSIISAGAERNEEKHRTVVKEEYEQVLMDGRLRIACRKRSEELSRGGAETKPEEGRTFVVSGKGETRKVVALDGGPVSEDFAAHLGRWTDFFPLVPGREVEVGETWNVELTGLGQSLELSGPVKKLKFECKLIGVSEGIATIGIKTQHTGSLDEREGQMEKETKVEMDLSGSLKLDIANKRPLSVQLRGTFKIETELVKVSRSIKDNTTQRESKGVITVTGDRVISSLTFSYP